jgi:glycosyltransferase involved in cell wall biosynthesis
MPVLNEAGYLEAAVASIVAQDHPGEFEIVLAVGPSTDGTAEIVARLVAADDRISIVENPGMDIPIGLNLAIAASVPRRERGGRSGRVGVHGRHASGCPAGDRRLRRDAAPR